MLCMYTCVNNCKVQDSTTDQTTGYCITGDLIKKAALNTHGAAGPSGVMHMDASLCGALASVACLCTSHLESAPITPFLACRLIPLDKCPSVRSIGIGDVPCHIVSKAILYAIGDDIVSAAGPLQTCTGHEAGSEAAVHAMKGLFGAVTSEAALLVDASNTFNCINGQAALHNISKLFSTILQNTQRAPAHLFVVGEGEISSTEGTTQGDPLAMGMYALAVVPLIRRLRNEVPDVSQVWFADDASAVGSLSALLSWWQCLSSYGPAYGYFTNAVKTILIGEPEHFSQAQTLFANTNIQITVHGQ